MCTPAGMATSTSKPGFKFHFNQGALTGSASGQLLSSQMARWQWHTPGAGPIRSWPGVPDHSLRQSAPIARWRFARSLVPAPSAAAAPTEALPFWKGEGELPLFGRVGLSHWQLLH